MTKLEYVWLDGYKPEPNLRSKVKIVETELLNDSIESIPLWNFDGSSTGQAEGKDSDVLLKPVNFYPNPFINWCQAYLVLCACYNKDGTPHITNTRVKLEETYSKCADSKPLFGIEPLNHWFKIGFTFISKSDVS